ncbi:MAG: aldose 1-epimerase [bacterium]|jgi:aldose 1-epimerase
MSFFLLESDTWRLWCDPTTGVQWMAAEVHREGTWHAVIPDCRPSDAPRPGQSETEPLAAASFHMLPYSNRIRDGLFEFQSQTIQLEKAESHAIHGALRKLPWKVITTNSSSLICQIDSVDHQSVNWPWPISATLEHRIQGERLISQITLTNKGDIDMPAGFGWHPYFVRTVNGSEALLTLPVKGVFPDAAGDCLPDGAAVALPDNLDFRAPKPLDASQRIDCCLNGLEGQCVLDWQQGGVKLIIEASDICQYLVLYNPDMPHFAVEPVTNANDAFNLATQSIESGVNILAPGESLTAAMSMTAILSN